MDPSAADTQFLESQIENTNLKDVPKVVDPSLQTGRYQVEVISSPAPELTYMLNQPGAGVSSASVITIANGDIATSKLGLGEYTIVVSDYQVDSAEKKVLISKF